MVRNLFKIAILLIVVSIQAQTKSDSIFLEALIQGEMSRWKNELKRLKQDPELKKDVRLLKTLAFGQYGYTGYAFEELDSKTTKSLLSDLKQTLDISQQMNPDDAEMMALLGTWYGFHIALSPLKVPSYGPKSLDLINTAYQSDSLNAFICSQKAHMTYGMPKFVGGGTLKALPYMRRAVKQGSKIPEWMKVLNHITLIRWEAEIGNDIEAKQLLLQVKQMVPEDSPLLENLEDEIN